MKQDLFFSGTSGLVVPVAKSLFPPGFENKSRLQYYASLYNSIEINSSFYKTPLVTTVKRWAEEVPENFKFTFKLSRNITHNKGLVFDSAELISFMQTLSHVGDKKGCLLIQFPPGLHADHFNQFEKLLTQIRQADDKKEWQLAVEFRNKSWYIGEVYEELKYHYATMVIHDIPASATPSNIDTADFVYIRFHGPGGRYRGSYPDEFLQDMARQISCWRNAGKAVYFYFNNTMGDALKNLNSLNACLSAAITN
ncbi:MAG: DUF72 domain-containing protein [Ferruginibacter sp.]